LGGQQVHDFNPGVTQNGLFWTTVVSSDSVDADLAAGTATLQVSNIQQKDFFDFENAILGNGATPRQGRISFRVVWTADGPAADFDNAAQQFRGTFSPAIAQMEWSGRSGDYEFESAPLAESITESAQLGAEVNGSFY
jgi:hypothetical protein